MNLRDCEIHSQGLWAVMPCPEGQLLIRFGTLAKQIQRDWASEWAPGGMVPEDSIEVTG